MTRKKKESVRRATIAVEAIAQKIPEEFIRRRKNKNEPGLNPKRKCKRRELPMITNNKEKLKIQM